MSRLTCPGCEGKGCWMCDDNKSLAVKAEGAPMHASKDNRLEIDPSKLTIGEAFELRLYGGEWCEGACEKIDPVDGCRWLPGPELAARYAEDLRAAQPPIESLRPGDVVDCQRPAYPGNTVRAAIDQHGCYVDHMPVQWLEDARMCSAWRLVYRAENVPQQNAPQRTAGLTWGAGTTSGEIRLRPNEEPLFASHNVDSKPIARDINCRCTMSILPELKGDCRACYGPGMVWHAAGDMSIRCGLCYGTGRPKDASYPSVEASYMRVPWDGSDMSVPQKGDRLFYRECKTIEEVHYPADPRTLKMVTRIVACPEGRVLVGLYRQHTLHDASDERVSSFEEATLYRKVAKT